MTLAVLHFVIINFCGVKDQRIDFEQRAECVSFMGNCSIPGDGKTSPTTTTNKRVDKCKSEWAYTEMKYYAR